MNPENILCCIGKDDFGGPNPNEKNAKFTRSVFGRGNDFLEHSSALGKPYVWAQRLAGIHDPNLTFVSIDRYV